jgi:RNA polymerase sigma factor (sigma-70 family)
MSIASLSQVLRRTLLRVRDGGGLTDGHLLDRFVAERDQAAFEELVRRHGPMVLRVCRRVLGQVQDAEDAFQATFIVLARRADRIVKHASVGSWLYGVAYRVAIQARRRIGKDVQRREHADPGSLPGSSGEQIGSDLRAVLDEELQALPEKLRAPVVLCYFEGKTNAEAAQMLGYTTNAIEKQLIKARTALRNRLARRVLALPACGLATLLAQETATAALPGSLLAATVKAAAGSAGAGNATPAALALAGAFLQKTAWKRLLAAAVLIFAGLAGAWGLVSVTSERKSQPGAAVPRLHAVFRGHTESIMSAAFSPDGKLLATGSADRTMRLWEVSTQKELFNHLIGSWVYDVKFSPDGKLVAVADGFWTVRILDTNSGAQRAFSIKGDNNGDRWGYRPRVYCLAFTPDGKGLASAVFSMNFGQSYHQEVQVWDVATLKKQTTFVWDENPYPQQLSSSADGRFLMVITCNGMRRWNLATRQLLLPTATDRFIDMGAVLACSPDGQILVKSHPDGKLRLWKSQGATQPLVIPDHYGYGRKVALTPDSSSLASQVDGGAIKLWDTATGKELLVFPRESGPKVSVLTFSADARKLCLGCSDGTVEVWNLPPAPR